MDRPRIRPRLVELESPLLVEVLPTPTMLEETKLTPSKGVVASALVMVVVAVFVLVLEPALTCTPVVIDPDIKLVNVKRFLHSDAPKPSFLKLAGATWFNMLPSLLIDLIPLNSCKAGVSPIKKMAEFPVPGPKTIVMIRWKFC